MRFITRIPVPEAWGGDVAFAQYGRGVPFFPVIGLIVGVIAALCHLAISHTGGGPYIGAAAYVLALILLTGGFHLDGLADTCDGVFSARTRERMLEIMRDSRLGTYGGVALVFCILIKVLTVISLAHFPPGTQFALLVSAPVIGRSCMVLSMYRQRYARDSAGMGNAYIGQIGGRETAATLLLGMVIVGALAGTRGLLAGAITYLAACGVRGWINRRLQGQTGDTLGAVEETGEMLFLLTLLWF